MIRKRINIILCLILLVIIQIPNQVIHASVLFVEEATETEETTTTSDQLLGLHAISAVLMDADTGRVLYEKNGYEIMPMASTTKVMTCIIALENGNLDDMVTVSALAASQPKVHLGMQQGEQFTLRDLLYSLMLESHNDSAYVIAEHIGGSVTGFADMMNQKAKELGCDNTYFITPNGLDAEDEKGVHSTTAEEMGKIMSYAIKNEEFLNITRTQSYTFLDEAGRSFSVNNKNAFLTMMDGALSGKTGFTGNAGYCYVGALRRDDRTFIAVVLACGWPTDKTWKWEDTTKLMNYGIENYEKRQLFDSEKTFEPVPVVDGQQEYVDLYYTGVDINLLIRSDETANIIYDVPETLQAPVAQDTIVGSAKYYIDEELYKELPIYTSEEIKKIDYKFCLDKIFKMFSL